MSDSNAFPIKVSVQINDWHAEISQSMTFEERSGIKDEEFLRRIGYMLEQLLEAVKSRRR